MSKITEKIICRNAIEVLSCDHMTQQFTESIVEQAALAAIRDALLPKLLSGEIMVKDAERFVEAAV